MGGMSIDGLVTGLDTTSLIQQLLSAERMPQRLLQRKQSELQQTVSAFKELNTKFQAIRDAADDLTSGNDWSVRSATSSDEGVVTTDVTGTPAAGTLSFTVTSLAATHTLISGSTVAGTDAVVADGTDFTVNGTTITAAEYGGGTLAEVAQAINDSGAGVSATAVQVSPGNYRLQLAAEGSGAAGSFTVGGTGLSAALGTFDAVTVGADAAITVGTGPGAYEVTSTSNTFSDVMPGLAFTAVSMGSATVTVGNDGEAIADKVEALVTAMNDAQKFVADNSTYDEASGKGGIFLGESMPGRLRTDLHNALIDPVSGSTLVGRSVGIETDRYGAISFDREAFLAAYADDPGAVEAFFGANVAGDTTDDGIAERVSLLADNATRLNTGRISTYIEGREARIDSLDDQIERWDVRLELRETMLRRQFAHLETALGRMQQQGQWLAGQLASLPTA